MKRFRLIVYLLSRYVYLSALIYGGSILYWIVRVAIVIRKAGIGARL